MMSIVARKLRQRVVSKSEALQIYTKDVVRAPKGRSKSAQGEALGQHAYIG